MQSKELALPQEFSLALDGVRLAGLRFGAAGGELVIALHGWLDNAESFALLANELEGVNVLALDLAGHGRSGHRPRGAGYPVWGYVADLMAVLEQLELERVHLLGHSLGAGVASLVAGAFPERVASLVLIDGLAPLVTAEQEAPAQLAQAIRWRQQPAPAARAYADRARMVQARMRGRFPVSEPAARRLVARGSRQVEQGWQWSHDLCLHAPSDLRLSEAQVRAFLQRIEAPVQLYLADGGIANALLLERSRCIRDLQIVEVGGGHHLHMEPETVAGISTPLLGFYQRLGVAVTEEVS